MPLTVVPELNNNFFNVTHSYSSKSAIHSPYGKFVKVSSVHVSNLTIIAQIRKLPQGEDLDLYIANYGKQNIR